jgi:hypothetical protein
MLSLDKWARIRSLNKLGYSTLRMIPVLFRLSVAKRPALLLEQIVVLL